MSPFEEQIAKDNAAVFVNDMEFAEKHDLNGVQALAVVQKLSITSDISTGNVATDNVYGLYGEAVMVNFSAEILPELPAYGDPYMLDGKQYIVNSCNNDMGIITLELLGNER